MSCAATKCTNMANTVGKHYRDSVISDLQAHPFSLMIDESNDRKDKVLAMMARYYNTKCHESQTVFVSLLECTSGTARCIFDIVDSFFR